MTNEVVRVRQCIIQAITFRRVLGCCNRLAISLDEPGHAALFALDNLSGCVALAVNLAFSIANGEESLLLKDPDLVLRRSCCPRCGIACGLSIHGPLRRLNPPFMGWRPCTHGAHRRSKPDRDPGHRAALPTKVFCPPQQHLQSAVPSSPSGVSSRPKLLPPDRLDDASRI